MLTTRRQIQPPGRRDPRPCSASITACPVQIIPDKQGAICGASIQADFIKRKPDLGAASSIQRTTSPTRNVTWRRPGGVLSGSLSGATAALPLRMISSWRFPCRSSRRMAAADCNRLAPWPARIRTSWFSPGGRSDRCCLRGARRCARARNKAAKPC